VRAQARAKEQRGNQNHAFHGNPPCLATIILPVGRARPRPPFEAPNYKLESK
jgi:hypothetical protein